MHLSGRVFMCTISMNNSTTFQTTKTVCFYRTQLGICLIVRDFRMRTYSKIDFCIWHHTRANFHSARKCRQRRSKRFHRITNTPAKLFRDITVTAFHPHEIVYSGFLRLLCVRLEALQASVNQLTTTTTANSFSQLIFSLIFKLNDFPSLHKAYFL